MPTPLLPAGRIRSFDLRAVEKINYPILLVFCAAVFVAMKRTYLDMLTSSRLDCGSKILRHLGYFIPSTALMQY
jgi:hypothetical protein